jgi:hypothetical protein
VLKIFVEDTFEGEADADEAENGEGSKKEMEDGLGESELEATTIMSSFAGVSPKQDTDTEDGQKDSSTMEPKYEDIEME